MAENSQRRRGPGRRFPSGKSGNPGGRPKSTLSKTLAVLLAEKCPGETFTNERAVAQKIIELARGGDKAMIDLLFDRLEGKVAQPMELGGTEGGPLKFTLSLGDGASA